MEQKLNQTDENELMHFKHVQQVMNSRTPSSSTQRPGSSMVETHLSYIHSRLNQQLNIRIINEEEKYIYLINKLKDYSTFVKNCYF